MGSISCHRKAFTTTGRKNKRMYSSYLEEIMGYSDEKRKTLKENLLRHGDPQDLILLAHIEEAEKSQIPKATVAKFN